VDDIGFRVQGSDKRVEGIQREAGLPVAVHDDAGDIDPLTPNPKPQTLNPNPKSHSPIQLSRTPNLNPKLQTLEP
jgi:hypothetical protein